MLPGKVREADLWTVLKRVGPAPKTKRTTLSDPRCLSLNSGELDDQESGIKATFPNRALNTPVVTAKTGNWSSPPHRDGAIGYVAPRCRRRRVEIERAMVKGFHLDREPPRTTFGKGRGGSSDRRDLPVVPSLAAELRWYLPLRAGWAERAESDSGTLVCRWDGEKLVGVREPTSSSVSGKKRPEYDTGRELVPTRGGDLAPRAGCGLEDVSEP